MINSVGVSFSMHKKKTIGMDQLFTISDDAWLLECIGTGRV